MLANNLVEFLAQQPKLWDIFEKVFGDNQAKEVLYKSKVQKPCRLLDFGCATGNTAKPFIGYDYLGVDKDLRSIEFAKKKWVKFNQLKFMCLDISKESASQKLGKFDAILFAGTGHHLKDKQLVRILKLLSSHLGRNGAIHYIDTIKPDDKSNWIVRWLCSIDRGREMRTVEQTIVVIKKVDRCLKIADIRRETVGNTLLPQPDYIYIKLVIDK